MKRILALCSLLACGGTEVASAPDAGAPAVVDVPDGGERPATPGPELGPAVRLAVGVGEPTVFLPTVSGEPLLLQRGCQGAQHVFTSLRILDPADAVARVSVSIHRVEDDRLVSVPVDVRLPLEPDPFSDRVRRITGLTPVVEVPSDVVGREVEIRATYTTEAGEAFTANLRGTVRWGTDSCGAH